jgi:aspartyl-tRNA(Asn)/glutamyl-tRNA(Gln) amidotransferase subunit B
MSRAGWEAVIGLEVHVQLATRSKIFCAAPTDAVDAPNLNVDPVTLGMPGVLPVLNREVVALALRVGLALGCDIQATSRFARKHYFYPDLPKGYQISQYDEPLCLGGGVWATVDGEERFFALTRIHLEEDAGKTIHDPVRGVSLVDFNRAGVPLIETVSEPDMRSADEAVAYMKALHQVVVAVGASDGNLERGNFRCDANVSVRRLGEQALGTKVEIKNVNSFRFVGRALDYEIDRQIHVLESGGEISQQTRLWDEPAGLTRVMRTKEEAHDYRYFPDPDLMALEVDEAWIAAVRASLPELPRGRRERFVQGYGLSPYDAEVLTESPARADYFEAVAHLVANAKLAANWVNGDLSAALNRDGLGIEDSPVAAGALAELLCALDRGQISSKMAKDCFAAMVASGVSPGDWIARQGAQITDAAAIDAAALAALDANPAEVAAYLAGRTKLIGFFVGRVMQATGGKANPQAVNEAVTRLLQERRG